MDPLRVVNALCAHTRRGPCTDAERRGATLLHDALRGRGDDAWLEPEWVRPQWAPALALAAAMGVAASLLSVAVALVGAALASAAALALALEATGRQGPARWPFRRRATQSVVVEPADHDAIALLICARTDSPRQGVVFGERWRRIAARLPLDPRGWAALAALAVVVTAVLRHLGVDGLGLGIAQFVPTVLLLLTVAAAIDIALSPVSPGANDPAAAAAAALAIHAELTGAPLSRLSPGLILYGAGEAGPVALRRLLRRDRRRARDTVIVDVGPAGAGEPIYATRHQQLRRAGAHASEVVAVSRLRRAAPRRRRLPVLHVSARVRRVVPRSRRPDDVPAKVDRAAIDAVVKFAVACVHALDAELAGPVEAAAAEPAASGQPS
jgi:hypothetical protein